mgnify:CR=1 FL=1
MSKIGALVAYKGRPAHVVSSTTHKYEISFSDGSKQKVREKDFRFIHPEFSSVHNSCPEVDTSILNDLDVESLVIVDGGIASLSSDFSISLKEATIESIEVEETYRHMPTHPLDENGQGDAHVSFAFSAHRAVVDVDQELGLIKVVELITSQDVGRVLNPLQLQGQLEGGAAQGLGLAVLEEINVVDGVLEGDLDLLPHRGGSGLGGGGHAAGGSRDGRSGSSRCGLIFG